MSASLWSHGLYSPWNSLGQNTGVGSLSLVQGIFPTQESNPGLSHCRQILYQLSHQGSTRILEGIAYPFSTGSSWPKNQTGVSCIAGRLFTNWAIRGAHKHTYNGILLNQEKEWYNAICIIMNGPRDNHTEESQSGRERQILYAITYICDRKYSTNEHIYIKETRLRDRKQIYG